MTTADYWLLGIAVLLVLFAGLAGCADAALVRVSRARVGEYVHEGRRGARALAAVVADLPRHTNLLLLLRVTAEMTAAVVVTVVLATAFQRDWASILTAGGLMTVVSYVLVGVGPRTIGRQHPYGVALRAAPLTRALAIVLGPVATLLILLGNMITPGRGFREGPFSTEVELRELVDLAEARGVVEHGERQMIHSVVDLGDTIVREVMVPRPDVVWIERTKSQRQALALALRSGFSRIPVIGENVDDVVGVVYLKDLVGHTVGRVQEREAATGDDPARSTRVEEVMRPASFVPESKPVDELLRDMQARRIHMAIVVDEYGGTAGLVTIEDILEEIVGEIADEYDMNERAPVEWLPDGSARVVARLTVEDLAELFGIRPEALSDVETVGGLMARELGRVPIQGAQVDVAGLRLVAESTGGRRNRIDTVLVSQVASEEATPAEPSNGRRSDEEYERVIEGIADGEHPRS